MQERGWGGGVPFGRGDRHCVTQSPYSRLFVPPPQNTFLAKDPRKYSFAVRTEEKWNRLPDEVKSAPTGKAFKEKLKRL